MAKKRKNKNNGTKKKCIIRDEHGNIFPVKSLEHFYSNAWGGRHHKGQHSFIKAILFNDRELIFRESKITINMV